MIGYLPVVELLISKTISHKFGLPVNNIFYKASEVTDSDRKKREMTRIFLFSSFLPDCYLFFGNCKKDNLSAHYSTSP